MSTPGLVVNTGLSIRENAAESGEGEGPDKERLN